MSRALTRDNVFAIIGPVNWASRSPSSTSPEAGGDADGHRATAEDIIKRYAKEPKSYIFRVSLNDGIRRRS
jgi:hypothetical protein